VSTRLDRSPATRKYGLLAPLCRPVWPRFGARRELSRQSLEGKFSELRPCLSHAALKKMCRSADAPNLGASLRWPDHRDGCSWPAHGTVSCLLSGRALTTSWRGLRLGALLCALRVSGAGTIPGSGPSFVGAQGAAKPAIRPSPRRRSWPHRTGSTRTSCHRDPPLDGVLGTSLTSIFRL
jgi:hypothetical protein